MANNNVFINLLKKHTNISAKFINTFFKAFITYWRLRISAGKKSLNPFKVRGSIFIYIMLPQIDYLTEGNLSFFD